MSSREDGLRAAATPDGPYYELAAPFEITVMGVSEDPEYPFLLGGAGPLVLARLFEGTLETVDISSPEIREGITPITAVFGEPSPEGPIIWVGLRDGSIHRRTPNGEWSLQRLETRSARCTPQVAECGRWRVGARTLGIRTGNGVPLVVLSERCSSLLLEEGPDRGVLLGGGAMVDDRNRLTGLGRVSQPPLLVGGSLGQLYELEAVEK